MEFVKVENSNLGILYNLNLQLAVDENQKDLFTASRNQYSEAFLESPPILSGFLGYVNDKAVGFYIYNFKFASYLGSKVLYIEDMYLDPKNRTSDNKYTLINHAIKQSIIKKCCRVEMRVLKTFNFGYDVIEGHGFKEITKWDVYRFEQDI